MDICCYRCTRRCRYSRLFFFSSFPPFRSFLSLFPFFFFPFSFFLFLFFFLFFFFSLFFFWQRAPEPKGGGGEGRTRRRRRKEVENAIRRQLRARLFCFEGAG